MKARYAVSLVLATGLALFGGQPSKSAAQDPGNGGIPYPFGRFSDTSQGSIAVCVDPTTFAESPAARPASRFFRSAISQR